MPVSSLSRGLIDKSHKARKARTMRNGKIGKLFMVLALVLSFVAMPVMAEGPGLSDVTQPTVAVDPATAGVAAKYTIGFTTSTTISSGGTVTVVFPSGVPTASLLANTTMTADGSGVSLTTVAGNATQTVVVTVGAQVVAGSDVVLEFAVGANIVNPVAGEHTLTVKTSAETTPVTSEKYTILAPPTVTSVQPGKGNVGDTMWVEVKGTNFVEDATTLDFGAGVSVVAGSYQYVGPGEIDCQVTIAAAGAARYVIPTTAAGAGTNTTAQFDPNAQGTKQVDVWDKYTPVVDLAAGGTWDADTLVFQETAGTIQGAVDAADGSAGEILMAHAATYDEHVSINKANLTVRSHDGPATTIIDASGEAAADVRGAVQIWQDNVTLGGDGVGFTIIAPDATVTYANQYGVELFKDGTASGITIEGNIIRGSTTSGSDSPQVGIHLWGSSVGQEQCWDSNWSECN